MRATRTLFVLAMALGATAAAAATPNVESVEPDQGVAGEVNPVLLRGEGFEPSMTVGWLGSGPTRVGEVEVARRYNYGTDACDAPDFERIDVASFGDRAYVTAFGKFYVVDVSIPEQPAVTSSTGIVAQRVVVESERAYTVGSDGLKVLDLVDPDHPQPVAHVPNYDTIWNALVFRNGHAYACGAVGESGYLDVFALDPTSEPVFLDRLEFPHRLTDAVVRGNRLYAVGDDLLHVFDIGAPEAPQLIGSFTLGRGASTIDADSDRLIVVGRGVTMLDIGATPDVPVEIGGLIGETGTDVVLSRDRASILSSTSVSVLGVHDPTDPTRYGAARVEALGTAMDTSGDTILTASNRCVWTDCGMGDECWQERVVLGVFDVSHRPPVSVVSRTPTSGPATRLLVDEPRACACVPDGVEVFDIPTSGAAQRIGLAEIPCPDVVEAGRSYRRVGNELEVFDVGDPSEPIASAPVPIGDSGSWFVDGTTLTTTHAHWTTEMFWYWSWSAWGGGPPRYTYVWFGYPNFVLRTHDLQDPENPVEAGSVGFPHHALDRIVEVGNARLRIDTTLWYGFQDNDCMDASCPPEMGFAPASFLVDVSDPWSPVIVEDDPGCPSPDVIGDGDHGITLHHCRDDRNAAPIARYWDPGSFFGGFVDGRMVLRSPASNELRVVDLDPPVEMLGTPSHDEASIEVGPIQAGGPYEVVATGTAGTGTHLTNAYRLCEQHHLVARLEPALSFESDTTDPMQTVEWSRTGWRIAATGDPPFSDLGRADLRALLDLPTLPGTLEVRFDWWSGGETAEVLVKIDPEADTGIVVLRGGDQARLEALWNDAVLAGGWPIPRIDDHHFGDLFLDVTRTGWTTFGLAANTPTTPVTQDGYEITYRYTLENDRIAAASTTGPAVDLVVRVVGVDTYTGCETPVRVGYLASRASADLTLCRPDPFVDRDGDARADVCDNCPDLANAFQYDLDGDGLGDECDVCPAVPDPDQSDSDGDGRGDACDVCPSTHDPDQDDTDRDGAGDACDPCPLDRFDDGDGDGLCRPDDNCPDAWNPDQADHDVDGAGDVCDVCPGVTDTDQIDRDRDGYGDLCDVCRDVFDPDQGDLDRSGIGDACNGVWDRDGDDWENAYDNCPAIANTDQADNDSDGAGDACDADDDNDGCPDGPDADPWMTGPDPDGDGVADACDNCPQLTNPDQADLDEDGLGDNCDDDDDGDGTADTVDNCPRTPNADQVDTDGDTRGDACDVCPFDEADDADADGVCGDVDNCPDVPNPDQADWDTSGIGNACNDAVDRDGDEVEDDRDNCPDRSNSWQQDFDGDGLGDVCDNCVSVPNLDQSDGDADGAGDVCDNCPDLENADQRDRDRDGLGDACDNCLYHRNATQEDTDADGLGDACDNCPDIPNINQSDSDLDAARAWASTATASSEWGPHEYGANRATGPWDVGACTDSPDAWAPLGGGDDPEWLELRYATPVYAEGVDVYETQIGGFVTRIEVIDTGGAYHEVWAGADTTACGEKFRPRWTKTVFPVTGVRLHTVAEGWEEIDAVQLVGDLSYDPQPMPDGVGDVCDNCPDVPNADQADSDGDGVGDACE